MEKVLGPDIIWVFLFQRLWLDLLCRTDYVLTV